MASLPIGVILFLAALLVSTPLSSWLLYLNFHSIAIVCGGTVALLLFSTPMRVLRSLFRDLRAMGGKDLDIADHAQEFDELSAKRRLSTPSNNELINYAIELWDNGSSMDIFHILLSQRREKIEGLGTEAVQALRNLAKYPPALGMTGTVMGLVTLFVNLSAENRANLGPALGLALTATFFGLIVANGIVMPLADRLHVSHLRRKAYYQSVYEVLLLVNRREPATLIRGEVQERAAEAA
jgi:chemotaxis protein MotA